MKEIIPLHILLFFVAFILSHVHGIRIPFERVELDFPVSRNIHNIHPTVKKTPRNSIDGNIENYFNNRYSANFTINGKNVALMLDTGSPDTWVMDPSGFLGQFNNTGVQFNLGYGEDGSDGMDGTISFASLGFGNFEVENQVFLDVTRSTKVLDVASYGMNGLVGLGFYGMINAEVRRLWGPNFTSGLPFFTNLFNKYTSLPAFFAIQLTRSYDLERTEGGNLDIAACDPLYTAVFNAPKLYQYPQNNNVWSALLDGLQIDGREIALSSTVSGTPPQKAVAIMDSGVPGLWASQDFIERIYQAIPGSAYHSPSQKWLLPCNSTSILSFSLGGQTFSMHPLDLSSPGTLVLKGETYTVCYGIFYSYIKSLGYFDIAMGDGFLRNTYSLFSLGDRQLDGKLGAPYMQLLSLTDPTSAAAETLDRRKTFLQNKPQEISPASAVSLS